MASEGNSTALPPNRRSRLPRLAARLLIAAAALWFGMNVPVYFRAVSPLVLQAATEDTDGPADFAANHIASGRPGPAVPLLTVLQEASHPRTESLRKERDRLLDEHPLYRWSGGPAPFYEQFLRNAPFLDESENAVLPSLLPAEHRDQLAGFLSQSANRNVHLLLKTRALSGWQRFYPVQSSSGQPLEATILIAALLEQSNALPDPLRSHWLQAARSAFDRDPSALQELESLYLGLLTLARRTDWLTLQAAVADLPDRRSFLFAARNVQENPDRWPWLFAALTSGAASADWVTYLAEHRDRGWEGLRSSVLLGTGAVQALFRLGKPLYQPPAFWQSLPPQVTRLQHQLKAFTESFPAMAMGLRALAFATCGIALAGCLRLLFAGPAPRSRPTRRLLLSLDSVVGGVLVMILLWVLIEPGLLDFRPNEQGSLRLNLAQVLPDSARGGTATSPSTMIDQVTILVLLLFFVLQLLVFVFGLLKIGEIRRRPVAPHVKRSLLDNEENLFDLGLYVGLGGTVASLILVVLNVVDASLMAAYASTLFGIIFVAILKVGFLRPFRRRLILEEHQ